MPMQQVFSSNLIQVVSAEDDTIKQKHFALVPQFWVFCLVTVALTFLTWLAQSLLKRRV
jgi:hypothetical protein